MLTAEEPENPFCRKCLIPDFVEDKENFLSTYVNSLDPDVCVDEKEYMQRLECCECCKHQQNGICMLCGCFTLIRAMVKNQKCPEVKRHW
ncbi:MAG: DUF6171 family protein [Lachnospiraceae bacterium]